MKAVLVLLLLLTPVRFATAEHETHGAGDAIVDVTNILEEVTHMWSQDTLLRAPKVIQKMAYLGWHKCGVKSYNALAVVATVWASDDPEEEDCVITINQKIWSELKDHQPRWLSVCEGLMKSYNAENTEVTCERLYQAHRYNPDWG